MATQTHLAFASDGGSPGDRLRAGLAVLGGMVVLVALITLGYNIGSLMHHTHQVNQPRQAGTLVHARAHTSHP